MASSQAFRYEPLDAEIDSLRILILQPQGPDVRCSLEHRTFLSKPVYETLSYTWGPGRADHLIYVNDEPYPVRKNLHDALKHLQQTTPRAIWVDAICIDQSNVWERNYQVNLMSLIYSRATCVLVWLNVRLEKHANEDDPVETRIRDAMDIDDNQTAIAELPYWTRVWVIQEYILPPQVRFLIDDFVLSDEEFYEATHPVKQKSFIEITEKLKDLREKRHTEEFRLESLIRTFRGSKCTETRDKIFGFLGLAHNNELDADYEISYTELYATLINFHQDSEAEVEDFRTADVYDRAAKLMGFSELLQETLQGEVGAECPNGTEIPDDTRLFTAKGATVSRILHLGPSYDETVSSMSAEKAWRSIRQAYKGPEYEQYDVLAADKRFTRDLIEWDQRRVDSIRRVNASESHAYRLAPYEDALAVRAAYHDISGEPASPRRFLGTRGCFGVAPAEARVGDVLASFLDCESYVVLRPLDKDCWTIVGKARGATVRHAGDPEFWVGRAVEQEMDGYTRSTLEEGEWDNGEGHFNGSWNVVNLQVDLSTLQQLTA